MFNIKKGKEEDIVEEEKKIAEKLKELRDAADGSEMEQPDYSQYSPEEQLSTDIAGRSIFTYDGECKPAKAYKALTKEVIADAERKRKRDKAAITR